MKLLIVYKDLTNIINIIVINMDLNKQKEINILCLHGCCQTQNMFRDILKSTMEIANVYCKNKNNIIKWHFIEAKYNHSAGGKTWYKIELDVQKIGAIIMDHDIVDETINEIDEIVKTLNIDVLIGFSQGGNVVDTYIVNKENNIKCAVIFSGYDLIDENRKKVNTPVMNICSDIDDIVKSKYMPIYDNMIVKKHDKGHKLPTSKPFVREIIEYIYINCI